MNSFHNKIVVNLFLLFFLCGASSVSLATVDDIHRSYGELLTNYVKDGAVDYQGLKKEEQKLDQYLALLSKTQPEELAHDHQLAFYINAYNAYTIKLILKNFKNGRPLKSIKKIGGLFTKPWSIKFCKIGGKIFSLDNIEHDIIRPKFNDPRVHFAINCAAKSCPPLISKPYFGDTLDKQLDENSASFMNDPGNNYLKGNTLYVTKIFKWFAEDFNNDPIVFIQKYANSDLRNQLETKKEKIKIKYLDYDWSLNGRVHRGYKPW